MSALVLMGLLLAGAKPSKPVSLPIAAAPGGQTETSSC
jgi:hypothetical protein